MNREEEYRQAAIDAQIVRAEYLSAVEAGEAEDFIEWAAMRSMIGGKYDKMTYARALAFVSVIAAKTDGPQNASNEAVPPPDLMKKIRNLPTALWATPCLLTVFFFVDLISKEGTPVSKESFYGIILGGLIIGVPVGLFLSILWAFVRQAWSDKTR